MYESINNEFLFQFLLQQTFGTKSEEEEEGEEGEEEENQEEIGENPPEPKIQEGRQYSIKTEGKGSSLSSVQRINENIVEGTLDEEGKLQIEDQVVENVGDDLGLEINILEEFALQYKDNIFYEQFDFSQLTVQDYYELAEIDSESEQKVYLKQKFKKEQIPELLKHASYNEEEQLNQNKKSKEKVKEPAVNFEVIGTCLKSEVSTIFIII